MQLDVEHLLEMAGGDPELADEVLDIFRNQADIWGKMLDAEQPKQVWADAAHTLKGSALSIGAHEFAELCKSAETLGRSDNPDHMEAIVLLADVKTGLSNTIDACAKASYELSKPGLRESKDRNS